MPNCDSLFNINGFVSGVCSHGMAVDYYVESVVDPKAFQAVSTRSFDDFKKGKVDIGNQALMGYGCRNR